MNKQIITNSESQIIRENTFILRKNFYNKLFLIDDYFSFLQYLIMFSLIVYIKVLIKYLNLFSIQSILFNIDAFLSFDIPIADLHFENVLMIDTFFPDFTKFIYLFCFCILFCKY